MMVACSEKDDLTPEPQPPTPTAITFDIEVTDVTATSANLWVTPSSDDVLYFFDMITTGMLLNSLRICLRRWCLMKCRSRRSWHNMHLEVRIIGIMITNCRQIQSI